MKSKWKEILMILSFLLSSIFYLLTGAVDISISSLFNLLIRPELLQPELKQLVKIIIFDIRIPRFFLASLCGGALAIAGVISQGLFRNPLASPTVLGVASGGSFMAVFAFYSGFNIFMGPLLPISAFAGAMLSASFLLFLLNRRSNWGTDQLLLAGLSLSSLWGALTSLFISMSLAEHQKATAIMHWILGGFSGRGQDHLFWGLIPFFLGIIIAWKVIPRLNILSLGEEIAESLSINTAKLRRDALISMSLFVGTTISIAGALPFVGLLVPHMTRSLIGPEYKKLVIFSAINGMTLCLLADTLARTILRPKELEVGIFTALMGAPFFLLILWQRHKET